MTGSYDLNPLYWMFDAVTRARSRSNYVEGFVGFEVMSDGWFNEYVFLVAVDKSHLAEDLLPLLDMEPIVLPAWDPMGVLA